MGYLDNTSITVDAILTKRGRELLSKNDGSFKITQFALGDDEIDYTLFNENHPNGTQYAAEAIENMPLVEAIPNGAHSLNSKLITLTRGASAIPYINHSYPAAGIDIDRSGTATVNPTTVNLSGTGNEDYIFTVLDSRYVASEGGFLATGGSGSTITQADIGEFSTIATSLSVRGKTLGITATSSTAYFPAGVNVITTSIIIEGVQSGAITSIALTINKNAA
jgi:hypothetical protein